MIDLVFWSFAVAVLPMVLALGSSMLTGAAGVFVRPASRPLFWDQPARLRPAPHLLAGRTSGSRFDDF